MNDTFTIVDVDYGNHYVVEAKTANANASEVLAAVHRWHICKLFQLAWSLATNN